MRGAAADPVNLNEVGGARLTPLFLSISPMEEIAISLEILRQLHSFIIMITFIDLLNKCSASLKHFISIIKSNTAVP